MKSFDNQNMTFTILINGSQLGNIYFLESLNFSFDFDEIVGAFVDRQHPLVVQRPYADISFCPTKFQLLCEEKKTFGNPSLSIDRCFEFSNIPYDINYDYCFESSIQRYFLDIMPDFSLECYSAMPFMLCFLERYCMEHEQVVSLLQEEKYQNNEFVKRYFKSREI